MSLENPPLAPVNPNATTNIRNRDKEKRRLRRLKIMLPILILLAFFTWGYGTNYIPSESMLPTLKPGDHVLTMKSWLAYPGGGMPARGDIVIFKLPDEQGKDGQGDGDNSAPDAPKQDSAGAFGLPKKPGADILVKRVIGLPGESVQIQGNDILINGKKLNETYTTLPLDPNLDADFPFAVNTPLKLGPDEIFLMGDNRNNSDDGRFWGALKRSNVLGRFVRVIYNEGSGGLNQKRVEQNNQAAPPPQ